jgi:hypothetical protein
LTVIIQLGMSIIYTQKSVQVLHAFPHLFQVFLCHISGKGKRKAPMNTGV